MTKKHTNYKEVKNVMHNEYKISREDILDIMRDTMVTEFKKFLKSDEIEHMMRRLIREIITEAISDRNGGLIGRNDIRDYVRWELSKQLTNLALSKLDINIDIREMAETVPDRATESIDFSRKRLQD